MPISVSNSFLALLTCFLALTIDAQQIQLVDAETQEPVSFATISFGDGLGMFADAEGRFTFTNKRYPGIDSLFISGMGYKSLALATDQLKPQYRMQQEVSELKEVVVTALPGGKHKNRKQKAVAHADYFKSWLPTVESEVAVRFDRYEGRPTQITTLLLPVNTQEEFHGKKGNTRPFSTLLRIQFYENHNGLPGREIPYGTIVFVVTEAFQKDTFALDIEEYRVLIPEQGLFVSVQVLGVADAQGKLIESKKYNEIKTKEGIEKVAITFRPLLPFTNTLPGKTTFVRRIFFNDKKWQAFNFDYNPHSKLLREGYANYGMGAELRVYESGK